MGRGDPHDRLPSGDRRGAHHTLHWRAATVHQWRLDLEKPSGRSPMTASARAREGKSRRWGRKLKRRPKSSVLKERLWQRTLACVLSGTRESKLPPGESGV